MMSREKNTKTMNQSDESFQVEELTLGMGKLFNIVSGGVEGADYSSRTEKDRRTVKEKPKRAEERKQPVAGGPPKFLPVDRYINYLQPAKANQRLNFNPHRPRMFGLYRIIEENDCKWHYMGRLWDRWIDGEEDLLAKNKENAVVSGVVVCYNLPIQTADIGFQLKQNLDGSLWYCNHNTISRKETNGMEMDAAETTIVSEIRNIIHQQIVAKGLRVPKD